MERKVEMSEPINPGLFWKILGMRAVGAAIVTAQGRAGPAGFLALSATHVTANPPSMLVTIGQKTRALSAIVESNHFAINYVAEGGDHLLREFGGKGQLKGADRFSEGEWTTLSTGAPTLVPAVGCLDCQLQRTIEFSDSLIAIGTIVAYRYHDDRRPLVSFGGGYL